MNAEKARDLLVRDLLVEEARQTICHRFGLMLNAGISSLRVRVNGSGAEAWFYAHDDKGWHKTENALAVGQLVQAIEGALDMLF